MDFAVNYWAIIVTSIINMALGMVWYGPFFGRYWMRVTGVSRDMEKKGAGNAMYRSMFIAFILALISNYVLAQFVIMAETVNGMSGWAAGAMGGFWIWLGFILIAHSGVTLWEGKPWKLWALYSGYYLVLFLINGAILAAWM